jgi:hypothetical protein
VGQGKGFDVEKIRKIHTILKITAPSYKLGELILDKFAYFGGLDRTRTCDLTDVNGAF